MLGSPIHNIVYIHLILRFFLLLILIYSFVPLIPIFSLTTCTWHSPRIGAMILHTRSRRGILLITSAAKKNDENILNDLKQTHKRTWSHRYLLSRILPVLHCAWDCVGVGEMDGWMSWRERWRKPTSQRPTTVTVCAENWFEQHFYTRFLLHVFSSQHTDQRDFLCRFFLVLAHRRLILEFTWIEFGCKIASFRSLLLYFSCEKSTNLRSEVKNKQKKS